MMNHPADCMQPREHGIPRGRIVMMTDVTVHQRAEEEREPMHRRYAQQLDDLRRLLEATPEGIVSLDLAGQCTFANQAAAQMLGYDAQALCGEEFHRRIHHSQADGSPILPQHSPIQRALEQGRSCRVDNEVFWRADNTCFAVEYVVTPLWEDDELRGAVISFRDISEHRRLEERFRQSQKLEPLGRLAARVTHDFNNLLTVISGYSDLLLQRLRGDRESCELLAEIQKAHFRASALTHQVLAFTRKETPNYQRVNLNTVVGEFEKMVGRLIGQETELIIHLEPALGHVLADGSELLNALHNLAINASDAMPAGGILSIETANVILDEGYAQKHPDVAPGPYVLLAFSDTGCGMPLDVQAHLFEPFFTTKEGGNGIGLCAVAGIIQSVGGHIGIASEPGRGTTIKIFLPRLGEGTSGTAVWQMPHSNPEPHGKMHDVLDR